MICPQHKVLADCISRAKTKTVSSVRTEPLVVYTSSPCNTCCNFVDEVPEMYDEDVSFVVIAPNCYGLQCYSVYFESR